MTTRLELLPDVYLTAVQTSRFKTACFSLSFLRPLRQEEAGMNALLPSVLLRGSESAPSIRAIADRLDALCGASVACTHAQRQREQLDFDRPDCSRILAGAKDAAAREAARALIRLGGERLRATPRGDVEEGFTP